MSTEESALIQVTVAYAEPNEQAWLHLEVPAGTSVREAIERSGILTRFPRIDLEHQSVGVFAKITGLDTPLHAGDRVEIYRGIVADPATVPRRPTAPSGPAKD